MPRVRSGHEAAWVWEGLPDQLPVLDSGSASSAGGGWRAGLRRRLRRLHRLVHHRLPGGREPLHHLRGAVHDAHGAADRLDRQLAGPHRVLDRLGDLGEDAARAARSAYLLSRNSM